MEQSVDDGHCGAGGWSTGTQTEERSYIKLETLRKTACPLTVESCALNRLRKMPAGFTLLGSLNGDGWESRIPFS